MKKLRLLIAASFMGTMANSAHAGVWTSADANLRGGPGTDYPVYRTIHECRHLSPQLILRDDHGSATWVLVKTRRGTWGWVHASLLRTSDRHCHRGGGGRY